jgi:hypothetical protein
MNNNQLTCIDSIRNLTSLRSIELANNLISSNIQFLFKEFHLLYTLNLTNNRIDKIDFDTNLTNSVLYILDLSKNRMEGSVSSLSSLNSISRVNLSSNRLSNIFNMTDAVWLYDIDISFNPIMRLTRINTINIHNLKVIYIDMSQIDMVVENVEGFFNSRLVRQRGDDTFFKSLSIVTRDDRTYTNCNLTIELVRRNIQFNLFFYEQIGFFIRDCLGINFEF